MQKRTFLLITIIMSMTFVQCASSQFSNYVTRKTDKLYDGEKEVRFISFNIPNLHYVEDYLPFEGTNPWRLPNEYEIRDGLKSIKQLGGKVTRIYVLSVKRAEDSPDIIRHVEGPGQFNEEAFKTLDLVMKVANEEGVRVIIPFVDNWHWWGGPKEYAAFRGKEKEAFWTDKEVIEDFKKTINFLVNRKNSYTGVTYKEDKALFAWETGNELEAPFSWTKEIAAYVKSLDNNHLLVEGIRGKELTQEALEDINLDILSTHHYGDPKFSLEAIDKNQKVAKGKKPYFVGEYGIIPTPKIREITDKIINDGLAGGMIWSLRPRVRSGGFYHHYEYNNVESYRFPGFASGDWYDEKAVLEIAREKAFQIDGLPQEQMPIPETPVMLDIKNVGLISWQGSTGAQSYSLERKEEYVNDWIVLEANADDSKYQYRPLFNDKTAEFGKRYFYRINAKNESGASGYSMTVGPIEVTEKMIVDEMENFEEVFQKEGELKLLVSEDIRKAKEDRSRLTGSNGSYVIYQIPGNALKIQVDYFVSKPDSGISLLKGSSMADLEEFTPGKEVFSFAKNDYGFFDAVRLTDNISNEGTKFLKVKLNDGVQISRIEITYKK
ncbi:MAG: cellulase family glycosylhydrolase [Melioribacteraceae bacterium]|nr:cellulase family glycosylhydrolase [Melioribacteraceae bacterium]